MSANSEHYLVSKQSIAKEIHVKKLLEEYGVELSALPTINADDLGIAHLNAKAGDVIRCERISHITGKTTDYWRRVTE
ncbi:MAG: DNA-directed RNA polymerase subunit RpoH/Rpb5 C-terminal domain-containing protein [Candidatus Micrarchaeia archaeon]